MIAPSYPARQRNRRLVRSLQQAIVAVLMFVVAGATVGAGLAVLTTALLVLSLAFAGGCWRSLRLARRSAIGARSERRVRGELEALESEGWRVRHSLPWRGGGDIDHVAIAPGSVVFAIETKTRAYASRDLARIVAVVGWLMHRRAAWCRQGAIAVMCLAGVRGVEYWEGRVAVVSVDRLVPMLRRLAGTTRKPRFLL
jgi:hypothetical protein